MRTFLWLSTAALVAAGLAVVAVADYVDSHPNSSINRGLARMALGWTRITAQPAATNPAAETPSTPPVVIDLQPEYDDTLLRDLKIISELSNTPELIPVPPTEVTDSNFATDPGDEFTPPKAGESANPFKDILIEVTEDHTSPLIFGAGAQKPDSNQDSAVSSSEDRLKEITDLTEKYQRMLDEEIAARKLCPNSAPDAAVRRARLKLGLADDNVVNRDTVYQQDFIENLRQIQATPQRVERVGIDFDGQSAPRTVITSDFEILPPAPPRDCRACGVCAILNGICECMSDFVAGLFGSNVEVEIGVCPDLPTPPPAPQDVHNALMLMSWPRGLPAECCPPQAPPGYVLVPIHPQYLAGQWQVGGFGPCPQPAPCPACQAVYPCPTAPVMPVTFVQAPYPAPMPSAPQFYPPQVPPPPAPPIMRTQYLAQQPPCCPVPCQACPPAPHVIAFVPYSAMTPPPRACGELTCNCPRTSKGFAKEVTVDFKDEPLCEVLEQFRQMADINIVCDKPALDDVGVGMDLPVTLKLDKVPCRVALKHTLRYCGLACKLEDDIVVVTSEEEAEEADAYFAPMPCPMAFPVPPAPVSCCPVATAAVTAACPAPKCCGTACCEAACAKGCCEKECGGGCVVSAPRVKVATPDGTILEIQIIMTKAKPCCEPPVKQAGFNVPEGFDAAGLPVSAIFHPQDLPPAEFPDDLPPGEDFPNFIGVPDEDPTQ